MNVSDSWLGPLFSLERLQKSLSSTLHEACCYQTAECPANVRQALEMYFPQFPAASWQQRWAFGGVYVNGLPAKLEDILPVPFRIEYLEPAFDIEKVEDFYPCFSEQWIVHEDDDLIVAYKPAGLSGMPNREQHDYNLKAYLERHYGHPLHFPSRLDTSTAGLVLVSRSARMHNALQRQFETRQVEKIYLCELQNQIRPESLLVDYPIGKDSLHPILRKPYGEDAKSAKTFFKKIADRGDQLLYAAYPETGRTHQIRVHACAALAALVGDNFYGGPLAEQLHLLSFSTGIYHPFRQEGLQFVLPQALWPKWLETWQSPLVDLFPAIR
jgi:tRNA pseudouridine32 synthase/23S rRNA pseudouridine746 synthase